MVTKSFDRLGARLSPVTKTVDPSGLTVNADPESELLPVPLNFFIHSRVPVELRARVVMSFVLPAAENPVTNTFEAVVELLPHRRARGAVVREDGHVVAG